MGQFDLPNPWAVPDKNGLRLNDDTLQSSMPPLTATPPAGGAGLNLSSLGAQTIGARPGELSGQAPTPPSPAPLPPQVAQPPVATPPSSPMAAPATPPPPPSQTGYQPLSAEDAMKYQKLYGDELRRRTEEIYEKNKPGLLAPFEAINNHAINAREQAKAEMSPEFLRQIMTGQYHGDQSSIAHEKEATAEKRASAYVHGMDAKVDLQGDQAALARAKAAAIPEKQALDYNKYDLAVRAQSAKQALQEISGEALKQGAKASEVTALGTVMKELVEHPEVAGPTTEAGQLAGPFFRRTFELAGAMSAGPQDQQGRGLVGQQIGVVGQMAAPGATPAMPTPFQPSGAGAASAERIRAAAAGPAPRNIGPINAAPQPPPLPGAAGALDAPPQNDALRTLGSNILTARPGAGGPPQLLNQGGQGQVSNRPGPVTGSLNAPANEGPIKDRIRKMFKGGDQLSEDILQQEAVAAVRLMDVTKNKPDKMPPSTKWLNSYRVVHGKPWEAPAQ